MNNEASSLTQNIMRKGKKGANEASSAFEWRVNPIRAASWQAIFVYNSNKMVHTGVIYRAYGLLPCHGIEILWKLFSYCNCRRTCGSLWNELGC
jgi:hypothetical protein